MTRYTVVRSPGAIALGAICALGTAIVLFWHVRSVADITSNHVMIALALIVTLGAAHLLLKAGWRHPFAALAFLVLFLAGTAVCVTLSAGRGAEVISRKVADVGLENGKRSAHEGKVAEANVDRKAAKAAHEAALAEAKDAREKAAIECATGKAIKCDGKRATADAADKAEAESLKRSDQADSHYWMLVAQLADMKPDQVANVDLKQAAKVFAFLTGYDVKKTMEGVELLWPFMLALLTEFGTIAFFNYGFGHKTVSAPKEKVTTVSEPKPLEISGKSPRKQLPSEAEAVLSALKRAKRPVTNDELAELMGVSKSESSKRVTSLNGAVQRVRVGREVAISLPNRLH